MNPEDEPRSAQTPAEAEADWTYRLTRALDIGLDPAVALALLDAEPDLPSEP